ncbi:luciferase domain-containing protein [Tenggerimyces flavus]|uniref:Luciferase family protein n=1 Tax=Tenggerimyces flavus TaxID=1708749 RepID=A0ABV7YB76_9ACTN|nr:luciferase family protein [Tenggerimyces flavus]MBM7785906.1 phospholipase/carboxylesterase [Tenggerimyces flavus]
MTLTPRSGARPATSDEGPHRQLDQHSSPELWGRLVHAATTLQGVVEGLSGVSVPSSRALLLDDLRNVTDPATSLNPEPPLEPVHLHGVTDTSLHLCLPRERAAEVCALGWGEPHGYVEHDTEIMVYGPRDDAELAIVLGLIEESLAFARSAHA